MLTQKVLVTLAVLCPISGEPHVVLACVSDDYPAATPNQPAHDDHPHCTGLCGTKWGAVCRKGNHKQTSDKQSSDEIIVYIYLCLSVIM